MINVRDATLDDAEKILEIYDFYVKRTAITFEYDETPNPKVIKIMFLVFKKLLLFGLELFTLSIFCNSKFDVLIQLFSFAVGILFITLIILISNKGFF